MTRRPDHTPLYPSEKEIARMVMGERAAEWPAKAALLERDGLPKIDTLMGGRYWPKVEQFFRVNHEGLDEQAEKLPDTVSTSRVRFVPPVPDGPEDPHAESPKAYPHRRRQGADGRRARA